MKDFFGNLKSVSLLGLDLRQLFTKEYLFEKNPGFDFAYADWGYLFVVLNLTIGFSAIIFAKKIFKEKPKVKLIKRVGIFWVVNSLFFLVYIFARINSIAVLAMRFIMVMIIFAFLVILIYLIIYWIVLMPKRMGAYYAAKTRQKYLPKKKK